MNKQLGIIIGVIVVVVLGAGAYMSMSNKPNSSQNADSMQESSTTSGVSNAQASIKSLIGAGKNVTCDIVYTDGKGTGKIFVSDKKFRGDFNTVASGKTYNSHMIQDGTYSYVWQEGSAQGTKFSAAAMEKVSASPTTQTQQSADLDASVDMKCSSGTIDGAKFTPPAEVVFQDMSAMMEKMTVPSGSGVPKMDSSACDAIADPAAKASCVGAMSQ